MIIILLCSCLRVTSVKSFQNSHSNVIYARLLWAIVMTDDDYSPVIKFLIDAEKLN